MFDAWSGWPERSKTSPRTVSSSRSAGQQGRPPISFAIATAVGSHMRVGVEGTIGRWPHREDLIASNEEIARAASDIASLLGRIASPNRYRAIIGLEAAASARS
jgi:uncharacterized protein (DUF849 family)